MITVVCSTRDIDSNYEKMLRSTSGVKDEDLEVLMFTNNGEMSLTQVYNLGLEKSKNNIVVFAHDDIEILSKNWAQKLYKHYEKTDYAILGVAGTKLLDQTGVWWNNKESMYGSVMHTDGFKSWTSEYSYNFGDRIKDVVVVDGVFFSCNKNRIKKTFNENYNGFHFYDILFCFENFKEDVRIGVHFDISIKHKSVGDVNDEWNNNRLKFIDAESTNLPQSSEIDIEYIEPNIVMKNQKKLAIVIPTKNKVDDLLIPCINSLIDKTNYSNYKIYVADTGSSKNELDKTKIFINGINKTKEIIKLIEYDYYNFSKINNDVIKNKIDEDTELILFCNNDIEMVNDAISIMIRTYEEQDKSGTIGCRLHRDNGSLQHLGIALTVNDKNELKITHKYYNWDYDNVRMSKSSSYTQGNTAAFMLVSKKLFNEIGGYNEAYSECFEDVEFNLQCLLKKKLNITSSKAVCYHYESQTRERKTETEDVNRLLAFINENPILRKTFTIMN